MSSSKSRRLKQKRRIKQNFQKATRRNPLIADEREYGYLYDLKFSELVVELGIHGEAAYEILQNRIGIALAEKDQLFRICYTNLIQALFDEARSGYSADLLVYSIRLQKKHHALGYELAEAIVKPDVSEGQLNLDDLLRVYEAFGTRNETINPLLSTMMDTKKENLYVAKKVLGMLYSDSADEKVAGYIVGSLKNQNSGNIEEFLAEFGYHETIVSKMFEKLGEDGDAARKEKMKVLIITYVKQDDHVEDIKRIGMTHLPSSKSRQDIQYVLDAIP